jgi:hypothetical protein
MELQVWRDSCNVPDLARLLHIVDVSEKGKMKMKSKKTSLFEETKIQMTMKIFGISRAKAIDYIASKSSDAGQKSDDCSKNEYNINSQTDGEEFFEDEGLLGF